MKLQENKWSHCSECLKPKNLIQEESYCCDWCGIAIDDLLNSGNTKQTDYLDITVFFNDDKRSQDYQFCTWPCLLSKLKTLKTDYFIKTSFLHYDDRTVKGQTAKDFLNLIDWNKVKGKSGKYLGKKK